MKKLMMVVVVAFAAFAVHAAAFSWSSTGSRGAGAIYDGASTPAVLKNTTVYILTTATISQADLLTAARTDGFDITTKAIAGGTATTSTAGQVAATAFTYDGTVGTTYDFYYAAIVDDQILISTTKSGAAQESATTLLAWTDAAASTFSKSNYGTANFANAGWYSTTAVPEPTSGLLLILGMAGLMLRRRA